MSDSPKRVSPSPSTDRTSVLTDDRITDYSGTVESRLPVSEVSAVQLKPGPGPDNLSLLTSPSVALLGVQFHAPSVGVVILDPGYFGFMWWDGEAECRINGELASRDRLHVQGAQGGFHATGGARRTMGIALRRNDFFEALAALRGVDREDIRFGDPSLLLPRHAAMRLRTGIQAILEPSRHEPVTREVDAVNANPESAVFELFLDVFLQASEPPRAQRKMAAEHVVRRAEKRFFSAGGKSVSLADLCSASGVSQSTLYRAFHEVCGAPPLAYFRKRQLTNARRMLVQARATRGAVKQAALSAGFTELGRFSVDYRRLFGESPSVTLNR